MQVKAVSALSDNYIWLIQQHQQVIIVDPSEAQPVFDFLKQHTLQPVAILLTHNHADHIGGVLPLTEAFPELVVYGPAEVGNIAQNIVRGGDRIALLGLDFQVIDSAGHTEGHISYLMNNEKLFCGDALFSAGCGRVAMGNYQAQFETLQRFKTLADFVEIYAGHEYTQANLKFAVATLPSRCDLLEYQERVDILRQQKKMTLPSTIGLEKRINPFLQAGDLNEFIAMRQKKDNF